MGQGQSGKQPSSDSNQNNNAVKSQNSAVESEVAKKSESPTSSPTTQSVDQIVTVVSATTKFSDPELLALYNIPKFLPLLPPELAQPRSWYSKKPDKTKHVPFMSPLPLIELATSVQTYFREATNVVCEEQRIISTRMKSLETFSRAMKEKSAATLNTTRKQENALQEIDRIRLQVQQVSKLLSQVTDSLVLLHSSLPEDFTRDLPPLPSAIEATIALHHRQQNVNAAGLLAGTPPTESIIK